LSQLPALNKLSVRDADLNDDALRSISTITPLESLYLNDNPKLTDDGYFFLTKLPNLRALAFEHAKVTPRLIKIISQLPLERLWIGDMDLTNSELKQISTLRYLQDLHLEQCKNVSPSGLKYLVKMPSLGSLDLREMAQLKDQDTSLFLDCPNSIHLSLQGTNIGDEGMKSIAQSKVHFLDISNSKVSDRGLMMLASAKKLNSIRATAGSLITERGITEFKKIRPDINIKKESEPASMLEL
jgi:hypothetical protein